METSTGIPVERTLKPYLIGLVLALILTVIAFGLVAFDTLPRETTLAIIAGLAVIQILVHLRFFLHIDFKTTPRENLVALALAIVLLGIGFGPLWDRVENAG